MHVGFGDELVELLLGFGEVAHLPLELFLPRHQRGVYSVPPAKETRKEAQTHPSIAGDAPPPSLHSQPLDVILGLLRDELDALQDVGDVIDASLLHVQHLRGPVQVHDPVGRLRQQVEETLGGQVEGGVVARPLRCASRNYGGNRSTYQAAVGWMNSARSMNGKRSRASLHLCIQCVFQDCHIFN